MSTATITAELTKGRVRFTIVAMLFAVTMVNYADRATIAIAGPVLSKDLGLTAHSSPHFCRALKNQAAVGAIPKRI
jgi:ACS family glucarate transporter-like MFS transporter